MCFARKFCALCLFELSPCPQCEWDQGRLPGDGASCMEESHEEECLVLFTGIIVFLEYREWHALYLQSFWEHEVEFCMEFESSISWRRQHVLCFFIDCCREVGHVALPFREFYSFLNEGNRHVLLLQCFLQISSWHEDFFYGTLQGTVHVPEFCVEVGEGILNMRRIPTGIWIFPEWRKQAGICSCSFPSAEILNMRISVSFWQCWSLDPDGCTSGSSVCPADLLLWQWMWWDHHVPHLSEFQSSHQVPFCKVNAVV